MSKFIKYLGSSHLNSLNIALYDSGAVRVENVCSGWSLGGRTFASPEAAEEWFDGLEGKNLDRLGSAMNLLIVHKSTI